MNTDDVSTITAGLVAAVENSLGPAATQAAYPGHFKIVADGSSFGTETTWPGLDSWQMAGAYLKLGRIQLVLDYFDFVHHSQRPDGNIPFAILPADSPPDRESLRTYMRGLRYPEDVYTFKPAHPDWPPRKWIGLFEHWITGINPLRALATTCYLLTAQDIVTTTADLDWLKSKIASLDAAARYLLSLRSPNGLISGAGFYSESPPRHQWDGVTQCYVVHAFRGLATLYGQIHLLPQQAYWQGVADALAYRFREVFWRGDHFAEYVHPQRGLVDLHGLSDVNWAAVAFEVASESEADRVWPQMMAEQGFWYGDVPTLPVSRPFSYQTWEYWQSQVDVGFEYEGGPLYDAAAMGRVWHLELEACAKRGEDARIRESVLKVCRLGLRNGGYWFERYRPVAGSKVMVCGPKGYCEYPAVLVRAVLGRRALFGDIDLFRGREVGA